MFFVTSACLSVVILIIIFFFFLQCNLILKTLDQPQQSFADNKLKWVSFSLKIPSRQDSSAPLLGLLRDSPPLPHSLYGRTDGRSYVRWSHYQIFSAWWVTNFSYPCCFFGALRAPKLRYKQRAKSNGIRWYLLGEFDKEKVDSYLCQKCKKNEKFQDWIVKYQRIRKQIVRFFTKQINPRSLWLWGIKGTEECTLKMDSSDP